MDNVKVVYICHSSCCSSTFLS